MRARFFYLAAAVGLVVSVVAFVLVLEFPAYEKPLTVAAATLAGTAGLVAALATAAAAGAAQSSAAASLQLTRDSHEALARALRPNLRVLSHANGHDGFVEVVISNRDSLPAHDVVLTVTLVTGAVVTARGPLVDWQPDGGATVRLDVRHEVAPSPDPDGLDEYTDGYTRVVIEFSDFRGHARWSQVWNPEPRKHFGNNSLRPAEWTWDPPTLLGSASSAD